MKKSEIRSMIKEELKSLNEANKFTLTVKTIESKYAPNVKAKTVDSAEFDNELDAKKHKKALIKKYNLVNHGGYIVNYKDGIELVTNF